MFPVVIMLAGFGLLAWINSQPKTPPGGGGSSSWDAGLMRDWAQRQGMDTTWVVLGSIALVAGLYVGSSILIGMGVAAIGAPFVKESIGQLWDRVRQGIDVELYQSVGSAMAGVGGALAKQLGPVGGAVRGLAGLARKLKGGVGAVQSLVDRVRPSAPPRVRGVFRATSGALFAGATVFSILALLEGDAGESAGLVAGGRVGAAVADSAGGGVAHVDAAWLEALGRQWFTYDGDLGSWLGRLEPYLVPGATGPLGECARRSMGFPLVWRLARTSIVEGPYVEVQGRLADLEYGIAGRGAAVGHPGIRERYGVELGPDDIGVRLAAVVARELPPEKAQLPGTDIITRPQKVTVQLFVKDGRAVPDETECGRGVLFVG